jgi:hypothetical protein
MLRLRVLLMDYAALIRLTAEQAMVLVVIPLGEPATELEEECQ